jgi:hypothetical protein
MTEPGLTAAQDKLFVLARAARGRIEAAAGAAVVDETGRTYNGAAVVLPALQLSALHVAAVQAASAGAARIHDAVLVGEEPGSQDLVLFTSLADPGAELLRCAGDRTVLGRWTAT